MYADKITDSMEKAMSETSRRRTIQEEYNAEHGIVPKTIKKDIRDLIRITKESDEESVGAVSIKEQYNAMDRDGKEAVLLDIELQMKDAAKALDFEKAATLRDTLLELKASK